MFWIYFTSDSPRKSARNKRVVERNDVTEFVEILEKPDKPSKLKSTEVKNSKKESKKESNEESKEKEKKKSKEQKKNEKHLKMLEEELLNVKALLAEEQRKNQRLADENDRLTHETHKLQSAYDVLLDQLTKRTPKK